MGITKEELVTWKQDAHGPCDWGYNKRILRLIAEVECKDQQIERMTPVVEAACRIPHIMATSEDTATAVFRIGEILGAALGNYHATQAKES